MNGRTRLGPLAVTAVVACIAFAGCTTPEPEPNPPGWNFVAVPLDYTPETYLDWNEVDSNGTGYDFVISVLDVAKDAPNGKARYPGSVERGNEIIAWLEDEWSKQNDAPLERPWFAILYKGEYYEFAYAMEV